MRRELGRASATPWRRLGPIGLSTFLLGTLLGLSGPAVAGGLEVALPVAPVPVHTEPVLADSSTWNPEVDSPPAVAVVPAATEPAPAVQDDPVMPPSRVRDEPPPTSETRPSDTVRADPATGVTVLETSDHLLDVTPPAAATVTGPDGPSASRSLSWTVRSGEDGVTASCRVLRAGAVVAAAVDACTATPSGAVVTTTLPLGAPDGSYELEVRLADSHGNAGTDVGTGTAVLDTTAPGAVAVTAPPSPGSTRQPTWQLSGEAGAPLHCRLTPRSRSRRVHSRAASPLTWRPPPTASTSFGCGRSTRRATSARRRPARTSSTPPGRGRRC